MRLSHQALEFGYLFSYDVEAGAPEVLGRDVQVEAGFHGVWSVQV